MSSAAPCPPADELSALAQGEGGRDAGLREHLARCPSCAARFQALVDGRESPATPRPATLPTSAVLPPPPGTTEPHEPSGNEPVRLDFLAPPEGPGEIGRLGPYRVLGVLGQGGMGVVLRGEDARVGRAVALKV